MNNQTPYFDAKAMPAAEDEYVAWIDIMGIQSAMMRSSDVAANFIFKFHTIVLAAKTQGITLYPVMDGVYVTTPDKDEMRSFLQATFKMAAAEFNKQENNRHRFLIKASVACGPVIHGAKLRRRASHILDDNKDYRNSILIGMPMILSNQGERGAPPFGVSLHYSAIDIATPQERVWSFNWWPWFEQGCEEAILLSKSFDGYFDWCLKRAGVINYDTSRIKTHKEQMAQYLIDVEKTAPPRKRKRRRRRAKPAQA